MDKRGNKSIGLFEIILMIFSSFAIAFILQENLVSGQGALTPADFSIAGEVKPGLSAGDAFRTGSGNLPVGSGSSSAATVAAAPAPPAEGAGPLEGLKTGVGKVFSGEATLGLKTGSTAGAFVGTLIGALAWAGVAYAVVQIIGSLLGVDKSALDAASYAAGNDIYK